ncbi:hypothetical protein BG262_09755 [Floricoccus penangensis]|uniref:Competence protein ComGE n=1 Tax=Floricoccus penangensis TaxID=1859475 RepID=A0A9Q5JH66_9LACT|nr:competence type IV pilus minor pilin ComGE [Floricoccus penangensis]OFI47424.1 hypothetical protein BG262_09755 [Floricoccus penangensis]
MVNIKKVLVKGYILLESLFALSLLSILTTIILFEVDKSRKEHTELLHQAEVLNVAKMAYDSEINDLQINGVSVKIEKSETTIKIYDNQKEVLKLEFK